MAEVFKVVLDVSISAGVLILLALGVRLVAARKPGIALPLVSVLILARLLIPVSIPSPLSIQNLFSGISPLPVMEPAEVPLGGGGVVAPASPAAPTVVAVHEVASGMDETTPLPKRDIPAMPAPLSAMEVCAIVWTAGMALMSACVLASNIRFARMLRRNRAYEAPGFETLLHQCKNELGIRRRVETVQVSEINTAAVYGVLRPRLLISPAFGWLSEEEKRYVLLHELAHIKRCDTALSLLMTILHIVHWFNPLVWLALAFARKDIETMCDIAVLKRTDDRRGYAGTLLRLTRTANYSSPRLAAALFMWRARTGQIGVLVSTYSIKSRIKMIARYKNNPAVTALALILVIALAATGCTGAVAEASTATSDKPTATHTDAVQTEIAPPEEPKFVLPEIPGQELIASYNLDFSSIAGDKARLANIKKAAEMLDGTVYPHWEETLIANAEWERQINIPDALGSITEENGWQNAAWAGWSSIGVYLFDDGKTSGDDASGYYLETADGASLMDPGGGVEIVVMAIYSASQLARLDGGYSYISSEDIALYESGELSDKYTECPKIGVDSGGIGVINNKYASDVILKIWVQDDHVIAAFYSDGPIAPANIPVGWRPADEQTAG